MSLRWGIVGASKIANDFCVALNSQVSSIEHRVVAVASRSKLNAAKFAQKHKIDQAYGCYEDLGKDSHVEVVFITLLNPQHYEVCKMMMKYGKHIVCAKPLAMTPRQTTEILNYAQEHCLFAMEGISPRFFPVYRYLSRLIRCKSLGDIKEVYVKHGFSGTDMDRIVRKHLGGGIVLDIGCLAIQLVTFLFGCEMPSSIKATGKINAEGVDLYFEADIQFSAGRKASIICSGLEKLENQATILTTKGPICIPNYWCPTSYVDAQGQWHVWTLPESSDKELYYENSIGLKYEADEVAKCIRSGKLQCDIIPPEESIVIAKIQQEIRKQLCVQYDCD